VTRATPGSHGFLTIQALRAIAALSVMMTAHWLPSEDIATLASPLANPMPPTQSITSVNLLRAIRIWLTIVILGLFLSGVTAFPLQHELDLLVRIASHLHLAEHAPALDTWFLRVDRALADTNARYPFLAYGTDWLAFAHIVLAILFIGPFLDPVRNQWVITFGIIASVGVFFLALIAGPIRGVPLYWRLIDCTFGLVCGAILLLILSKIRRLQSRP
jgi:hypothetical protein